MAIDVEAVVQDPASSSEELLVQGAVVISDNALAQETPVRIISDQGNSADSASTPLRDIIYFDYCSSTDVISPIISPKVLDTGSGTDVASYSPYTLYFYFKYKDYPQPRSPFVSFYFARPAYHKVIGDIAQSYEFSGRIFAVEDSGQSDVALDVGTELTVFDSGESSSRLIIRVRDFTSVIENVKTLHSDLLIQDQSTSVENTYAGKLEHLVTITENITVVDSVVFQPFILHFFFKYKDYPQPHSPAVSFYFADGYDKAIAESGQSSEDIVVSEEGKNVAVFDSASATEAVSVLASVGEVDASQGDDSVSFVVFDSSQTEESVNAYPSLEVLDNASGEENVYKTILIQDSSVGDDWTARYVVILEQSSTVTNIPISVSTDVIDQSTVDESPSISVEFVLVSDFSSSSDVIIAADVKISDSGAATRDLPVRVITDSGMAAMWAKQSFYNPDQGHGDDAVVKVLTDQGFGQDHFIIGKFVYDQVQSIDDIPFLEKRIVITDFAYSTSQLRKILPEIINYDETLVKVVQDTANGLDDIAYKQSVVGDSATITSILRKILPETINYDETLVKVIRDSSTAKDYPSKSFRVFDSAQSDEKLIRIVSDIGNGVSNRPVRVVHESHQIQDSIIRAVFVRDRARGRIERPVRVVSDTAITQESDPIIVINVFDLANITDSINIGVGLITIQDNSTASEDFQILLNVSDSGQGTSNVVPVDSFFRITELSRGAVERVYHQGTQAIVSDDADSVETHRLIFHLSEIEIVGDAVSVDVETITLEKEAVGDDNVYLTPSPILISDECSTSESINQIANLKQIDFVTSVDEIPSWKIYVTDIIIQESASGDDSRGIDLSQYRCVEVVHYQETLTIIITVKDEGIGNDQISWTNNIYVNDFSVSSEWMNVQFSHITINDYGTHHDNIVRKVFDSASGEIISRDAIDIYADLGILKDLAATWHWFLEGTKHLSDNYKVIGSDCYHALSVRGVTEFDEDGNPEEIHDPIRMGYDDQENFGTLYDYERKLPYFSYSYLGHESITQPKLSSDTHYRESETVGDESVTYYESNDCPRDGALGNQNTEVTAEVKVTDVGSSIDKAYIIFEFYDSGHGDDYISLQPISVNITDGIEDVEEVIDTSRTVEVFDSVHGDDIAAKVVFDEYLTSATILDIEASVFIEDSAKAEEVFYVRMSNFYDGDLLITIDPANYGRRTEKIVDFLHPKLATIIVRDESTSITSTKRKRFDYRERVLGSIPKNVSLRVKDFSESIESSIQSALYEEWKIVRETMSVSDAMNMIDIGKFVYDQSIAEEDSLTISNLTQVDDTGTTVWENMKNINSHVLVSDQANSDDSIVGIENSVIISDKVDCNDKEYPFMSRKVNDVAKTNDSAFVPYQVHKLQDEIVVMSSLGQYLNPDITIYDSNKQWGTGIDSIKLT